MLFNKSRWYFKIDLCDKYMRGNMTHEDDIINRYGIRVQTELSSYYQCHDFSTIGETIDAVITQHYNWDETKIQALLIEKENNIEYIV